MRRRFLAFAFLIFSFAAHLAAGGVLSSPRRVYVIKTEYFEVIFPKESENTARHVAENADDLYRKAKSAVGLEHDFSMPIIISPDSSEASALYTSNPYNRIVVFDSVPYASQNRSHSDDVLLDLLYREIFRAVSVSVRSPLNHLIYKTVGGDGYQPVSLINLPFSFAEGFSDLADRSLPEVSPFMQLSDPYCQQLLIQAKLEGHFPSWFQAASVRDIHPGNALSYAASTGFTAYLMRRYGTEKYLEFWKECGKIHLFFVNGIFFKVYGRPLSALWKDFRDSVPLPPNVEQLSQLEKAGDEVAFNDRQGLYEHVLSTAYGVVWYDGIRHEVDIFDPNSKFRIRQLLFIAEDITRLSLSPDGRYMAVSFTRGKVRDEFKEDNTRIFDLKEREFLDYEFSLREAGFVTDGEGNLCLAGISVQEKTSVLQIHTLPPNDDDSELIFESRFEKSSVLSNLNPAGNGKVFYLMNESLVIEDFCDGTVSRWILTDSEGVALSPLSVHFSLKDGAGSAALAEQGSARYMFSYLPDSEGSLVRAGFISLSSDFSPGQVFLQDCDVSGGAYFPFLSEGKLYYSARKFSHDELRMIPVENLSFTEGGLFAAGESSAPQPQSQSQEQPYSQERKCSFRKCFSRLSAEKIQSAKIYDACFCYPHACNPRYFA